MNGVMKKLLYLEINVETRIFLSIKANYGGKTVVEHIMYSILKRVRNLSQNAGNDHFRVSNFPTFSGGECPQTHPRKLAHSALVVPPNPFSDSWIRP